MTVGNDNKLGTYGCCLQKLYPHLDHDDACTCLHKLYTLAVSFIFNYSCISPICFSYFLCLAFWSLGVSDPGLSLNLLRIDRVMDSHSALHLPLMMNYTACSRSSAAINWLRNTEINIHRPRIGFCVCISTSFALVFWAVLNSQELNKFYRFISVLLLISLP